MGGIHGKRKVSRCNGPVVEPLAVSSLLQIAIAISFLAVHAKMVALAEKHREHKLAGLFHGFCLGMNNHAICSRQRAGRLKFLRAFHLDQAKPAGPIRRQLGVVAQGGDAYTSLGGGFEDCGPLLNFNGNFINR